MKKILLLGCLLGSVMTSFAAFPFYEPFANATASGGSAYAVGSVLTGQTNATGDRWYGTSTTANATNPVYVTNIVLSYSGLASPFGNSIRLGPGGNSGPGGRMFASSAASGTALGFTNDATLYYSLLIQLRDITALSTTGDYYIGFNNQGTVQDQTSQPGIQAGRLYFKKIDGVNYQVGIAKNTATVGYDPVLHTTNETLFIVVGYEMLTAGGVDDNVRLWVNPSSSSFGGVVPPTETSSVLGGVDTDISFISSLVLLNRSANIANATIVDEVRAGQTWAFVTGGPEITIPPVAMTNAVTNFNHSSTLDLTVTAKSGSSALSYQWQRNGVNLTGPNVSGATSSHLVISNVTNAGDYAVLVNNSVGTVTNVTTVTLNEPLITVQPVNQVVTPGSTARFTVTAVGTAPLSYRWQKDGSDLSNGGTISGATTTNLTIANVSAGDVGTYVCWVTNAFGASTNSLGATLTLVDPGFASEPQNAAVNYGGTATFAAIGIGTAPLSYRWQRNGVDLINGPTGSGSVIAGATTTNLTVTGVSYVDAGNYLMIVTNGNNSTASSAAAVLTVNDPYILIQPQSQTNTFGSTAVFSVVATGTPALSYLWYKNDAPLADGNNVSGSTTTNLAISQLGTSDAADYKVVVTGGGGQATSAIANLKVTISPGQNVYWDSNGTTIGAGDTPTGTWGTDGFWSLNGPGDGATGIWTGGATAVFSAGTDAINPFTVTVSGTQTVAGLNFEEGVPTVNSGTLSLSSTNSESIIYAADAVLATVGSVLAGPNRVIKTGNGSLRLNGANTFTGGVTIKQGSISVQADSRFGAVPSVYVADAIILDGGILECTATGNPGQNLPATRGITVTTNNGVFAQTAANGTGAMTMFAPIIGPGKITKIGPSVMRIENSNVNWAGGLDLNEGKVYVNASGGLGTGVVTVSNTPGILLRTTLTTANVTVTLSNNIVLIEGAQPVVGPPNNVNGANLELAGVISGPGGLLRNTEGTSGNRRHLILSGANTFSGGFKITQWPVTIANKSAFGTGILTIGDEFTEPGTQYIEFNGNFNITGANAITNPVVAYQQFSMARSITTNEIEFSGPLELANPNIPIYANYPTLTHRLSGVISSTNGNGFTKFGAGTLVLSKANAYSGGTTIAEGILRANNTSGSGTGSGSVTVSTGGTLGGSGTVAGGVSVLGGSISPGATTNQPGTLTLQNGLDLSNSGILMVELAALKDDISGVAGTDFDQVSLTGGTLSLGTSAILSLGITGTATFPDLTNTFWQAAHQWTVIKLSGGAVGSGNFASILNSDNTAGVFTTTNLPSGNVVLNYTPNTVSPASPNFIGITSGGPDSVTFSWNGQAGVNYQVQFKSDLNLVNWITLTNISGTGIPLSVTDNHGTDAKRFYRIVIP